MNFYKLMWIPGATTGIWNMKSEEEVPVSHWIFQLLTQSLQLAEWQAAYAEYYRLWLDEDDQTIYQWQHALHQLPLAALRLCNRQLVEAQILYWIDIDRTDKEASNFHWCTSPLSNEILINLGSAYPRQNRLIAPNDNLVMPT